MSRRTSLLIIGDLLAYVFSLILTLAVRYGHVPDSTLFFSHIGPFCILFVIFVIVGMAVGLYDKRAAFMRSRVSALIVQAQIINVIFGIVFFYFAPVAIARTVKADAQGWTLEALGKAVPQLVGGP